MAAKIEFFQLCEDPCLKIDLTKENIEKFYADVQNKYSIFSIKALSFDSISFNLIV